MWKCSRCGEPVHDAVRVCLHCGAFRQDDQDDKDPFRSPDLRDSTVGRAEDAPQPVSPYPAVLLRVEPPVASTLAVGVWILSVFAFFPVLGLVPTAVLAVCSLVLAVRRGPYPWDRRVGVVGLILSLVSVVAFAVWLIMMVVREPVAALDFKSVRIVAERSWLTSAMQVAVLVLSIVLHECAHAVAALWSGDGTAARLGRIRLNPLAHIDVFGSIILPAILIAAPGGVVFGWAKPVPIDRRQFRRQRRGLLAVTLAGVSVNLLLALACASGLLVAGSALRIAHPGAVSEGFAVPLGGVQLRDVPNAVPWELAITALKQGMLVNLVLFTFNVLPIPPLDGFGVLESVAPSPLSRWFSSLRPFGAIVLLAIIVSGAMGYLLLPALLAGILLSVLTGYLTGCG